MQAVEIKNLSFVYSKGTPNEKLALDNINLSIEEGSFVALIGATGSGKSTLIQHLNGLIKPQDKKQSSVIVGGKNAADKKTLKTLRFEVGMVFQYPEYQLFADTVEKDVAFGPKNMKLPADEVSRRVKRALETVGLDYNEFAERSPFDLSGGEKRRVAIAGVIAMEPKILVLDEPVAGLDPAGRAELLALIKTLQKEVSPTVILVSHNMDDVAALADRVVALKDGRIVADGAPRDVFSHRGLIMDIGLDLPTAARIVDKLEKKGITLSKRIITMAELKDALLSIFKKRAKKRGNNMGYAQINAVTDGDKNADKNVEERDEASLVDEKAKGDESSPVSDEKAEGDGAKDENDSGSAGGGEDV